MHELAVTNGLLKVVLRNAENNGAQKVLGVVLRIGEMSDIQEEWLQKYFDYLSRDTIAEGAQLNVERIPAVFQCEECREEFSLNFKENIKFSCPKCQGSKVNIIAGREFEIRELQVI